MVAAGIARAVVAAVDPDPRVDGRGIAKLREAGVDVEVSCLEAEARRLNAGFFARMRQQRPLVALKLATSTDGRIATAAGDSQWITGAAARAEGHRLRLRHDAILIGSGTALADDPLLTCRLPGLEDRSPVRVVLDRRLRLRLDSRLARTAASQPLWVFTKPTNAQRAGQLLDRGITFFPVADGDCRMQLSEMLAALAEQGMTRVLVEGGATIATAFLRAGLVDRLYLFDAPLLIGADGQPATHSLAVRRLGDARRWRRVEERLLDSDRLAVLEPVPEIV
jgi:diaminohydroxyphosphoribosylaminopyrimidine deaminase / 5-amino-6-(5-phosphoribosylamino)uracil reductase